MSRSRIAAGILALAVVAIVLVAINYWSSPSKPAAVVPASGTILSKDGTPLAGLNVMFWPKQKGKSFKTIPFSPTDAQGRFDILMLNNERGLPPGQYAVTANSIGPTMSSFVPSNYTNPDKTPWEVSIPQGGKTDIRLQISSE